MKVAIANFLYALNFPKWYWTKKVLSTNFYKEVFLRTFMKKATANNIQEMCLVIMKSLHRILTNSSNKYGNLINHMYLSHCL